MGFLKAMGRWAGSKIESFGKLIGSEKLTEAGRNLQDACAEKVAAEKPYDKGSANIGTTDRLNDILVSFSEGYLQQAVQVENECIRLVGEFYDSFIGMLGSAPDLPRHAANLKALEKGKEKIRQDITGGIQKPVAKRMSLDDAECLSILRMDAGDAKRNAMAHFAAKVIEGALANLADKVRKAMEWQLGGIQDYLSDLSEEQETAARNLKEQFEKMSSSSQMEAEERELYCIRPLLILDAIEEIHKQLG